MCGLVGLYTHHLNGLDALADSARAMSDRIVHRGPDDVGVWCDQEVGIALAHRRLSILDLSPAGHQPMLSASGRYVLAYNGEIYNHLEIRERLTVENRAPAWRGHSDTETLLAAIEAWGLDAALLASAGMFAIALWDNQEKNLQLARDRFGEKPLYYGWIGKAFAFASELKALHAVTGYALRINREALALYMRFCYVPAPRSIHQDIYKLEPGCVLQINGAVPAAPPGPILPGERHAGVSIRRWWSFRYTAAAALDNPIHDEAEALDELEQALSNAVKQQSLADVPLGAFLSGGVDSSLIVALMQKQSMQPVKSFTIGFDDPAFDESGHAKAVAQHLGTEHQTLMATSADAQAVIPDLGRIYDEPFADSSQIPTYLVCKAARRHVTVALSGDAGDELFGGYNRYFWGPKIWDKISWLPYPARRAAGALIQTIPADLWDGLSRVMPDRLSAARMGYKVHRLGARLGNIQGADSLYESLVTEWRDTDAVVRDVPENPFNVIARIRAEMPAALTDSRLRMMFKDTLSYLPDDILCKVDRAAMAASLETRVPYLDHAVAELAWRLPMDMKIRGHQGKWALRQVLYKYVPRGLIERPKAGFSIPVGGWLRGPLRDWAEALLDERRLIAEGYFNPEPIRRKWREHLTGRFDHTASLWCVLMFQDWLQEQG